MSVYLTLSASYLDIIVSSVLVTVHLLVEESTGFCRILATHYNLDFQIWKLFQPALVSVINFHIWKSRLSGDSAKSCTRLSVLADKPGSIINN